MEKTMVLWKKLCYYEKTMEYTDRKLWNFVSRRKKTAQWITKNYETLIYNGKAMSCTKTIKIFEQINSFKTLIYLGKRKIYEKILDMILY